MKTPCLRRPTKASDHPNIYLLARRQPPMPTPLSEHTTGSLIEQVRHPHDHQSSSILVALALAWHRRDHPRIVELGNLQEFAFSALSAAALPGISRFPRYRQGIIIIPSSSARPRARYAEAESRADEAVRQRYEGFEIIDAAEAESDGQDNDEPFSVPTIRSGFSEDESDDSVQRDGVGGTTRRCGPVLHAE